MKSKITAAVGDIPGYVKALQEYVQRNPDSDRITRLSSASPRSRSAGRRWQSGRSWPRSRARPILQGFGPRRLKSNSHLAKTVSENFADCAECESLRKLLPYLEAIAQRDNGGERIEVPLKKLFEDPLVADAWMVEMSEDATARMGQRAVLLPREPKAGPRLARVNHVHLRHPASTGRQRTGG